MNQPRQLNTQPTTGTPALLNRRRLVGRVFLGTAVALALSACGGGGGSSSDSGETIDLLAVYNKLETGMNQANVTALVGKNAPEIGRTYLQWSEGNQILTVTFNFGDADRISTASWRQVNPSQSLIKNF